MEFAAPDEIDHFYTQRTRYVYELLGAPDVPQLVEPMGGRLKAWEETYAPGKLAYREAMGVRGLYGRHIRSLPMAFKLGKLLFVHGGLSPSWAELGLVGLEARASTEWKAAPRYYQELDPNGIFRDPLGPLWHRAYCVANARLVRRDLREALALVEASQMFVGHTRTDSVEGGEASVPLVRQRGRVIMTDVGIGEQGEAGCALIIERGYVEAWSPGGARSRVIALKSR